MADPNERFENNVPGPFYVDKSCLWCGSCAQIAPAIFSTGDDTPDGSHAWVHKQPETLEEVALARKAIAWCPHQSIGEDPVTLELIPLTEDRQYDFAAIFGNAHPVELELGVGKGRFLIERAEALRDTNFIGVEWASRYYRLVAKRAEKRGLANFRILRDDAAHVVRDTLADASIDALHIYFPDPWPKARHHKRRLVQPAFVTQAARVLKDGGRVLLATDHEDYAAQMEAVFNADAAFRQVSRAVGEKAPEGVTNWEIRFRREGKTIHKFEYVRVPRVR